MQSIQQLYQKIAHGEAEPNEINHFLDLLASPENEAIAKELLTDYFFTIEKQAHIEKIPTERLNVLANNILMVQDATETTPILPSADRIHVLKTTWFRVAAAILILWGVGSYFYLQQEKPTQYPLHPEIASQDIPPGKEGAILTLADGSTVVLDSLANGTVANQNGTTVILKNGQLVYDGADNSTAPIAYNTVTTPKGRQFNIQLPDGTSVWLNAESSVQYPTRFNKERTIKITGEVYFEVAKDKTKPFLVKINDQTEIEVLGTSFNVNAYKEEATINATLLDGAIRIKNAGNQALLKPGEQAQIARTINIIKDANLDKVMAWKNGAFDFNNASLVEVMRQLERWYDIEVVYEKGIPDIRFGGKVNRGVSLEGLIRGLEVSEVHFRIEGRRLVVMP